LAGTRLLGELLAETCQTENAQQGKNTSNYLVPIVYRQQHGQTAKRQAWARKENLKRIVVVVPLWAGEHVVGKPRKASPA